MSSLSRLSRALVVIIVGKVVFVCPILDLSISFRSVAMIFLFRVLR